MLLVMLYSFYFICNGRLIEMNILENGSEIFENIKNCLLAEVYFVKWLLLFIPKWQRNYRV